MKKRERERERFARNERDRICGFSLLSTLLYRLPIDYNQEVLALLDVDLIIEAFDVISFFSSYSFSFSFSFFCCKFTAIVNLSV